MPSDYDPNYYWRHASEAIWQIAREANLWFREVGLRDRMIVVVDDETGLATESYITELKPDLN